MMRSLDPKHFVSHATMMALALLALGAVARAQNMLINGALHGTVTDVSGAVIPGARVVVRNLTNGQVREAVTGNRGFYTITQLPPGRYSVTVSKEGFSTVVQPNVPLLVNQDLEANYTLKLGQVTQRVQVTGAPPMLKTASATLGTVVGSTEAVDLPLNGRQFTQLILLTPGAAPKEGGQQSFYQIPIGGSGISPSSNGQAGSQNVFTMDGILNNHFFTDTWAISPPPDAIQEFNVQSHITDAQFGISSGSNVNVVTKTGGPQLHGDAWEFLRNSALDSANYFDNFANEVKPQYRQNQYGMTIGGPVILPGYDGRKKHTYFFGYWEGFRSAEGYTDFASVPNTAEKNGDFADQRTTTQATGSSGQPLLDDLGRPIISGQIYNPFSTREVTAGTVDPTTGLVAQSTGLVRDPFPGNIVPASMISPLALTYLNAFYPKANYGPGGDSYPNFVTTSDQVISSDQFGVGVDHTFGNNDMLEGKFYFSQPNEISPNPLLLGSEVTENHARMVSVAYTHIFTPTLLASFHYGYSNLYYEYTTQPAGTGLLGSLDAQDFEPVAYETPMVPEVTISPILTGTDQYAIPQGPMVTNEFTADVQKIRGSHTLSAGILFFHLHGFDDGWGSSEGFNQYATSAIYGPNTNDTANTGTGLASMLLGLPTTEGSYYGIDGANIMTNWVGAYLQDKWQATRKLNLQVGLRWDYQAPPHYLYNEFSMWNGNCPIGSYTTPAQIRAIEEECIMMPIPYTPAPTASNPTPLSWSSPNARQSLIEPKWDGWQPRFGFADALKPRTVVRGAFVLFDDHNQYDKEMQDPRGNWPFGGLLSLHDLNNGVPAAFLDDLPNVSTLVASDVISDGDNVIPNIDIPYTMEFNLGVQQQITPSTALTINYVGSLSRHQWGVIGYDSPLPNKMGPNAIPDGEPFPFLDGPIEMDENVGNANYNSLQVKLEKRFSEGLSFLASYTFSKCLDELDEDFEQWPQDTYNLMGDYGDCDYNFPNLFSFSYVYQLPFGKGMRFARNANRAVNALMGGWNLSGITTAQSGSPFSAEVSTPTDNTGTYQRANVVPGCDLLPAGFQQNVFHWYNTSCFTVPAPYTYGDSSRDFLRGPAYLDFDFSLYKNFHVTEYKALQFRMDWFNAFNRPNFSPPGGSSTGNFGELGGDIATDVDTPTFMQILSAAPAREIQFSLKLTF
jgi:hypothetical protein